MSYPSPRSELWYVVAEVPGGKSALLVGPYDNHSDAAPYVEPARTLATQTWPTTMAFATFGVARMHLRPGAKPPAGQLADLNQESP